jgi:hypothetical protein
MFLPFLPALLCGLGALGASLLAGLRHQPVGEDPDPLLLTNGMLAVLAVGLAIACALFLVLGVLDLAVSAAGERVARGD